MLQPVQPTWLADRFPPLHDHLTALLRGLSAEQWDRPTVAGGWRVRDVAAHLLDVQARKLAVLRDDCTGDAPSRPIEGYADLVEHINEMNAEWVRVARRLSPVLLVDFIELAGRQLAEFVQTLDAHGTARFAVAWAGEDASANWMDVGRDYTELWHHQQQIRNAVQVPGITSREWLHPVLDMSVRALPHAFRDVAGVPGESLEVQITGDPGGTWTLLRDTDRWTLYEGSNAAPSACARLSADTAWRIFFNGIPPAEAASRIELSGVARIGERLAHVRSVMV
ncbi:MAG TPA: maleylpyruvate isomerase family mycothiol-dependent enzyme [Longimicrobiaceae bacterium]|nr:maleylpyruvate isomerase family mycothiol-dependent enzyme [Longimicrobiaceae bacterium]